MTRRIYKLKDNLCDRHFIKGAFVFRDSNFPIEYLVLCDEQGEMTLDEDEDGIYYDWHPACEPECPWKDLLEEYKEIDE